MAKSNPPILAREAGAAVGAGGLTKGFSGTGCFADGWFGAIGAGFGAQVASTCR